jgi:hypothetical protein
MTRGRIAARFPKRSVADAPGTPLKGRTSMGSNAKKKTTMAKLSRENKLRERRLRKEDRKAARKLAAEQPEPQSTEPLAESAATADE